MTDHDPDQARERADDRLYALKLALGLDEPVEKFIPPWLAAPTWIGVDLAAGPDVTAEVAVSRSAQGRLRIVNLDPPYFVGVIDPSKLETL